ncbi:MAG: hypothetical protein P4L82_12030 [Ancalomicrobiaceae bacterium]|nr:hypothetical protein [Ancalomicrobiaceae bacterium]
MAGLETIGGAVAEAFDITVAELKASRDNEAYDRRVLAVYVMVKAGHDVAAIARWFDRANGAKFVADAMAMAQKFRDRQKVMRERMVARFAPGTIAAASAGRSGAAALRKPAFDAFEVSPDARRRDCRVSAEAFAADGRHEVFAPAPIGSAIKSNLGWAADSSNGADEG